MSKRKTGPETWIVNRVYSCDHCEGEVVFQEKATKDFRKKCPLCNKNSLILKSGDANLSILVGTQIARTWGMISQDNQKRKESEQGVQKDNTPWWRKGRKKVNFNVLKDPKGYIVSGKS